MRSLKWRCADNQTNFHQAVPSHLKLRPQYYARWSELKQQSALAITQPAVNLSLKLDACLGLDDGTTGHRPAGNQADARRLASAQQYRLLG